VTTPERKGVFGGTLTAVASLRNDYEWFGTPEIGEGGTVFPGGNYMSLVLIDLAENVPSGGAPKVSRNQGGRKEKGRSKKIRNGGEPPGDPGQSDRAQYWV